MVAAALLALAPAAPPPQKGVSTQTLKGYLDKMEMPSVPHPKSADTLVVPRTDNQNADREKLFQRLLETNHRAFATFFIDNQGDIGARFTFTTEDSIGFDSFRAAVIELLRITDEYVPALDSFMRNEQTDKEPPKKP